jgi:hypothetical protein
VAFSPWLPPAAAELPFRRCHQPNKPGLLLVLLLLVISLLLLLSLLLDHADGNRQP